MQNAAKRAQEEPEADVPREAFDSNCITPGTPFMGRLAAHLCFFFRKKIAEDPAWQKPRIIFSGASVLPRAVPSIVKVASRLDYAPARSCFLAHRVAEVEDRRCRLVPFPDASGKL